MFSFLYLQQTGKDSALAVTTKLKCAAGLAELTTSKYKSAARYFLLTNFDHCDFPNVSVLSVVTCFFCIYILCCNATMIHQNQYTCSPKDFKTPWSMYVSKLTLRMLSILERAKPLPRVGASHRKYLIF